MSILHYTIGLPPERNGGSVQYAYGLMTEQAKNEKVYALVCGDTLLRNSICRIKDNGIRNGIETFKLTDPLTPTLIYGTSNPQSQHRDIKIDYENIRKFIKDKNIKVMHLHTLMGIHKGVVAFIKSLGVRIVYTTHDFHGICSHYNLIDFNGELCGDASAERCALCNANEPSDRFLRLVNSSLYHFIKKTGILSSLKKSKLSLDTDTENTEKKNSINIEYTITKYKELIDYYKTYFSLIDKFHFNSEQTKDIFKHFIPNIDGRVIPVITSGIKDNRKVIGTSNIIKFGFIGNTSDYKGFPILRNILKELYNEGVNNIKILAYTECKTGIDSECPLIEYQPPYKYKDISKILYHLDGTIVPSKWYETFSLVTLESLAHGRPVIVSDHVGAKDIVATYNKNLIFSSAGQLKELLISISKNPEFLIKESERIVSSKWNYSIENHAKEILSYYYE